ncbi:carboxymuconolactone decarboxylase family protein [uncultured Stenotrophomonas sp.]|uniref:(R)-mandelonitrile lyase n=1 Tax=uncultured Stenotrophomonas sp. TaxID=165438 RepID=UPI0028E752F1|nr:carboxymuconolactone decarboxylase family protein [uncultured Stenotrophomonas sp.]
MNKPLLALISIPLLGLAGQAVASPDDEVGRQRVTRAGTQAPVFGARENFTGRVRVDPLFAAEMAIPASGAYVTFEPGARSAWHTHPAGQRLVVTAGTGLTQEWGKPVKVIRPGDVVVCPPGVKHWHGAGPRTAMTHLTVTGVVDGKSVQWLEQVSPEEYERDATAALSPAQADAALSSRRRAIPVIGAAAAGGDPVRLRSALAQGLDAGLSVSAAKEVLVQLYAYAGFPRSLNALGELMNVVEERKQDGVHDEMGPNVTGPLPQGAELQRIGRENQSRISGRTVDGPVFQFAPVINDYLQAHLFGAIFERDTLNWQDRELATVGILSTMPDVTAQLRSHIGASLRVGLDVDQLWLLAGSLDEAGMSEAGQRVHAAIDWHLAQQGETQRS